VVATVWPETERLSSSFSADDTTRASHSSSRIGGFSFKNSHITSTRRFSDPDGTAKSMSSPSESPLRFTLLSVSFRCTAQSSDCTQILPVLGPIIFLSPKWNFY